MVEILISLEALLTITVETLGTIAVWRLAHTCTWSPFAKTVGNKVLPQLPQVRGRMSGQKQQERMHATERQDEDYISGQIETKKGYSQIRSGNTTRCGTRN